MNGRLPDKIWIYPLYQFKRMIGFVVLAFLRGFRCIFESLIDVLLADTLNIRSPWQ